MNLVLDTNVLIATFIAKGLCHTLVEHCLRIQTVIVSEFIFQELREKLTQKFKYSVEDAQSVKDLLRSWMRVVEPVMLAVGICRDPEDDQVLGTAIAGNAACIITGDRDLLTLGKFKTVNILLSRDFIAYEDLIASD